VDLIHEQQEEGALKELEIRQNYPITIRPIYTPIKDVTSTCKWYSYDQFKPENQVKEVPASGKEVSKC
jgi:hypothetical protein